MDTCLYRNCASVTVSSITSVSAMTSLAEDMELFLKSKTGCDTSDINLDLDGTLISAHKVILIARSKYFEGLFRSFAPESNTVVVR